MRWLPSIGLHRLVAASILSVILSGGAVAPSSLFAAGSTTDWASGKSAGASTGAMALGAYGSKNASKQNISIPMTNGSTQMRTVDGSTSFNSVMGGAPSSGQFLEILMQPSASGDLSMVTVGQDTDANGSLDYSFQLGVPVSGVCANGFISCSVGTWNNCRPYGWVSAGGGKVAFASIPITTLGGCYCINSSCGSHLVWDNAAVVLKDLGGGILGAIRSDNASVMVSDVQSDLVSIRYYGRVVSNTPAATAPATATIPVSTKAQSYFMNAGSLEGDRTEISMTQGSNPDSMYYQMMNSTAFSGASQSKRCSIRRNGAITTATDASFSDSGTGSICTDHYIFMRIKQEGDVYTLELVDTCPSGLSCMHHNCGDDPGGDHWHTFKTFTLPPQTANYQSKLSKAMFSVTDINGAGCNPGGQMSMDAMANGFNTPVMGSAPCPASGAQYPTFNWSYLFEYQSDTYGETISDDCASIVADSSCRLRNEKVDGFVNTVQSFNSTGLNPLPSCKTFTGAVSNVDICRDWWQKEREYVCDTNSTWDLSGASKRFTTVTTTANEDGNILNFTDQRLGAGGWASSNNAITLPEADSYSECEKACKVRRTRLDTQVALTGVPSTTRTDQNTYDYYYFPCVNDVTCPAEPGDTIITDCSCLNEFGQAASVMQIMRLGGADSICSDGILKNP